VFSPRDNRIAFVSAESGNDEIYSINPDGSDMRRLTSNTWEWDKHPSWSSDGSQIVFWSNRDTGRRQLWVMNADGSNPHLLLKSTFNDWDPVWGK
jgi:TolB protein